MNKNKFFEKVGKLTFSIVLTGVLVTSVVAFFTGSWDELDENYLVTGTNWQDTVAQIKSKVGTGQLLNYYTKSEADEEFLKSVHVPVIAMTASDFTGSAGIGNNKVNKPDCPTGYTPDIKVNLDRFRTIGGVNDDDIIGTWSEDKGTYWYINGGDYDCGIIGPTGKITKGCGLSYPTSKISYTTYCTSLPKVLPVCSTTMYTCDVGVATIDFLWGGIWTCKQSSEVVNCGTFDFNLINLPANMGP